MEEKVNGNYTAQNIQVLEGLDPVRKRPGMYIGSTDSRGLHHLIVEVVDNSVDEALAGYCDTCTVEIMKDGSVSITDNVRGIPVDKKTIIKDGKQTEVSAVEVVLTHLHAGGKFGGGGYTVSGGLHGVGVTVVNALSEWLEAEVRRDGKVYKQVFNRGVPQKDLEVIGRSKTTGTKISFMPDADIFESVDFNYDTIKTRLREVAYLNKGLTVNLIDNRHGREKKDTFKFDRGIMDYVDYLNRAKNTLFPDSLYIEKKLRDNEVEIAMQYNDGFEENIYAYANNINTEEGGTHLVGFKNAITKVINDYAHANNILKDTEKLSGEDVREGLTAIISVKLKNPQFEGQTKTKLGNSEMRGVVEKVLTDGLGTYLEENPTQARELVLKNIQAQRARDAVRKARDLERKKNPLESASLPGKLSDCSDRDPSKTELFIVEGDSAGGTARQGRDSRFQAILALRGKILNVQKVRYDKALENQEIKNLITALGCGVGDSFDESKLRYNKIICMTDADVDGAHIRILLLTFFYNYMRPLIEHGHIYSAMPPLYKITKGKRIEYAYSDKEQSDLLDEMGRKGCDVQRYKGLGEMSQDQLWETTMSPEKRTLMKINMDDAVEADELFSILMGDQPELRRQFIEENATLVKNLDI